jgi:hypothetical protein
MRLRPRVLGVLAVSLATASRPIVAQIVIPAGVTTLSRAHAVYPAVPMRTFANIAESRGASSRVPFIIAGAVIGGTLGFVWGKHSTDQCRTDWCLPGVAVIAGAGGAGLGALAAWSIHEAIYGNRQ